LPFNALAPAAMPVIHKRFNMKHAEWVEQLRQTGAYETPIRSQGSWESRVLGRWDVWYYAKVIGIVLDEGVRAALGLYSYNRWSISSFRMLRAVEACGGRIQVSGLEHLRDQPGPVVIVGNHMSMLETFLMPCLLLSVRPFANVVKDSLLRYPFFGRILAWTRPISVGRRNPREDLRAVLTQGAERIRDGVSLLIFPQATRSEVFQPAKFNSMGAKLARRAGVPMIPVAVQTSFLGIGRVVRDLGKVNRSHPVRVRFGPPIDGSLDEKAAHRQAIAFISATLREWGVAVESTTEHDDTPEERKDNPT